GTSANLLRVWGADRSSVWIAGQNGLVMEWNGERLVRHDAGVNFDLRAIAPAGRRDGPFPGVDGTVGRLDGQPGSRPIVPGPSGAALNAATGWPDGGLLALGDYGLQHAGAWAEVPRPSDAGPMNAIWSTAANDVWACGEAGGLYHNTSGDFSAPERW